MKPTLERLRKWIEEADAIVIGAGAGLSAAAGFEYGGAFFKDHFPEMTALGYRDMYAAGFHPFPSSEEKGLIGPSISSIAVTRGPSSFIKTFWK